MTAIRKVTPVLIVDRIEPSLPLWLDRLGFEKTVELAEGDALGFVILVKDGVEIMYQSRASVRGDVPALADLPALTSLFIEVADIDAVVKAVKGMDIVVPRRRTFYGMDEVGIREAGGHVIMFAQPVEESGTG